MCDLGRWFTAIIEIMEEQIVGAILIFSATELSWLYNSSESNDLPSSRDKTFRSFFDRGNLCQVLVQSSICGKVKIDPISPLLLEQIDRALGTRTANFTANGFISSKSA
jgi:hypothetical protein